MSPYIHWDLWEETGLVFDERWESYVGVLTCIDHFEWQSFACLLAQLEDVSMKHVL